VAAHEIQDGQAGGVPGSFRVGPGRPVHRPGTVDGEHDDGSRDALADDPPGRPGQVGQPHRLDLAGMT
jgi:hypothetical protein